MTHTEQLRSLIQAWVTACEQRADAIRLHNLIASAPSAQPVTQQEIREILNPAPSEAPSIADEVITALAKEIILTFVTATGGGFYLAGVESVIRKHLDEAVSPKAGQEDGK